MLLSKAPFKFIVSGSQTLNPASPFDCLQDYPVEFEELKEFLSAEKINGVLFLTGDRHHSEVIGYDRREEYTLYDITSIPFTSSVGKVFGKEKENAARVRQILWWKHRTTAGFPFPAKQGNENLSWNSWVLKAKN